MFGDPSSAWVGVDRGGRATKVVQLRRLGGRVVATSATITPRWSGDEGGALSEAQRCAHEVKVCRALAAGWRGRRAAAVVSMSACRVAASTDDLPQGVEHSVGAWDAGPAGRYALSMPVAEVDTLCDGLAVAGLRCEVVDGAPLALARATQLAPDFRREELTGALDWGATSATLVATRGGAVVYTRQLVGVSFGETLDGVARELELSATDADRLVTRHGVVGDGAASSPSGLLSDALTRAAGPMVAELKRTLAHLGAKVKARGLDRLWVFGAGGTAPGLAAVLGQRVGVRAEPWRPAAIELPGDGAGQPCLFGPALALSALAWGPREGA